MTRLVAGLCVALFCATAWSQARAVPPDAVGGGFTDAGVQGDYFANAELAGKPAFRRRDVRIDFDWGQVLPVGGSTAPTLASFPRTDFSVRWTGTLIPRFSEPYVFTGVADSAIRLRVRKAGTDAWSTLVARRKAAGEFRSSPFELEAGKSYEVEIEYRSIGARARCALRWESPSVPNEVIDPVVQQGLNVNAWAWLPYVFADLMLTARYGRDAGALDANGWPTTPSFELIMSEGEPFDLEMAGTYLLSFQARAGVAQKCCGALSFQVGGQRYDKALPKGTGYESAAKATRALLTVDGSRTMLTFDGGERPSGGPGVRAISLMRPRTMGGGDPQEPGTVANASFAEVVANRFTVLRIDGKDNEDPGTWASRTRPGYAFYLGPDGEENWEYTVMLANETGRDLYITVPISADDEYFEKLAQLLRYGSDGTAPYASPTANPVYPPLNPNLRVYVELDNEIWNWAFKTTRLAKEKSIAEERANSATWKAINYDGTVRGGGSIRAIRRWHAMRTVAMSDAFRRVFGDAAMGARIRVLLEYQYDNYQDTALGSLDFIDGYFNNRTDQHVHNPKPVSYYVWGAGGADYYGLRNAMGEQSHTVVLDADFSRPVVPKNALRVRPEGSAWSFKGESGIVSLGGQEGIGGIYGLPTPKVPTQAAFLRSGGAVSQKVSFARPGRYAVVFRAAGPGKGWPPYLPFDIFVDQRKVSPRGQADARVSKNHAEIRAFGRKLDTLESTFGSAVFEIEEPGEHVIRFVAERGEPYLLLDEVRIASIDAMMNSGFAEGQAEGQVANPDYAYQLNSQANYARSFGLQVVAYEGGWSLGGDFEQLPMHQWAKLKDGRTEAINDEAIRIKEESGTFMNVWGVYRYWPSYDFAGADAYPIVKSLSNATRKLPAEATHGRPLPAVLRLDDADVSRTQIAHNDSWSRHLPWTSDVREEWYSWMLIASSTGQVGIEVAGTGEGRFLVEVDGAVVAELARLNDARRVLVNLTKGPHALRMVAVGEKFSIEEIRVKPIPAGDARR